MFQLFLEVFSSYANRLVVLNIACYKATALLPNGKNAHVTVRDPMWWKGTCQGFRSLLTPNFASNSIPKGYINMVYIVISVAEYFLNTGTAQVYHNYKLLIILIFMKVLVPSISNLCYNLLPINSDESSSKYG